MKLSISNIGWQKKNDEIVYDIMKKYDFSGLEIAPTRIFTETPYDRLNEAKKWADELKKEYNFVISSIQSIWYGRQEKMFGTQNDRKILFDYTKKAIKFAEGIGCKNLVFGCPHNRIIPDDTDANIAITFFKELGDYAAKHHTVIGMEANPPIYNTNYINDTLSAIKLIKKVDSDGFKLNLDVGTMVQNDERLDILIGNVSLINHVHISEPGLKPIKTRQIHYNLMEFLQKENYQGFISIEMGKNDDLVKLENAIIYTRAIFMENIIGI